MLYLLNKNRNIVIGIITVVLIIGILWYSGFLSSEKSSKNVDESLEEKVVEKIESTQLGPKITVYNFNTSWCRYSVMFSPEWAKFESMVENNPNIEAVDVKCDEEDNEQMCMNFDVPGYPSIVIVKDGERMDYPGQRNADDLLDYVSSL